MVPDTILGEAGVDIPVIALTEWVVFMIHGDLHLDITRTDIIMLRTMAEGAQWEYIIQQCTEAVDTEVLL